MKQKTCGRILTSKIEIMELYRKHGNIYKFSPNSYEQLCVIDSRKSELTQELYCLPDQFLYTKKGMYIGLCIPDYNKMMTLFSAVCRDFRFDKLTFFKNLSIVIKELEKLGLSYYDIHDRNFLVDKYNNFKVIDLDGIDFITDEYRITTIYNLICLVLEIYFFSDYLAVPNPIGRTLASSKVIDILPTDVYEYLESVERVSHDILSVNPYDMIQKIDECAPVILGKK